MPAHSHTLPSRFDLFCSVWRVLRPDLLLDEEDRVLLGQCDPDRSRIEVATKSPSGDVLPPRNVWETFWHEVVHAIDHSMNHDEADRMSHSAIDRMGRALAQVTWTMR
jgi:hypothetical protein